MGRCPSWLMGADCKSAGYAYVGSNPTRPTSQKIKSNQLFLSFLLVIILFTIARVAQW
jgi:hypothetical protein